MVRPMMVFGYDDAPGGHCEVLYDNCQLDVETGVVGGRAGLGRGFEVRPLTCLLLAGDRSDDRSSKLDSVQVVYIIVCDLSE